MTTELQDPQTPETPPVQPTEAEAAADFAAGYASTLVPATPAPTEETPPMEAAPEVPVPEFVQITKEQYQSLLESATKVDTIAAALEQRFGGVYGKMGGLERTLKEMQAATPSGQAVQVSAEDFKELHENYPEFARWNIDGMNRVLSKLKGTGSGPAFDEDKVRQILAPELNKIRDDSAFQVMDLVEPTWRDTARSPEFHAWFAAQPEDYRKKYGESMNPVECRQCLTQYKAASEKVAPKPPAKPPVNRFADAVQPRGSGGHAPAASTEQDAFVQGFKSATGH